MSATRQFQGTEWFEYTDEGSGLKFYANISTGERTWELPAELLALANWWRLLDPSSGRFYFYHVLSRTNLWDPPSEPFLHVIDLPSSSSSSSSIPSSSSSSSIPS